ncbi:hypothetical protein D3OALGB2SA_2433 [Olavius algarvensis associated proteobacterium Delta 3]|nr:hypothetical protein D3OALGB2SA_2433 [Olavius algarvensis associated proteobacterium Delta 3]
MSLLVLFRRLFRNGQNEQVFFLFLKHLFKFYHLPCRFFSK